MCGNLSQFHPNLTNSMGEIARLEKLTELFEVEESLVLTGLRKSEKSNNLSPIILEK